MLLCPPLSPRICSNSCPLSWWYYLTISSSAFPFSFCLQSFPASGSFPMSRLFALRGHKYCSFSFRIHRLFRVESFWIDWLNFLAVQRTLKSLLQHSNSEASILWHSAFFIVQLSHLYMTSGKTIALTTPTFGGKVVSLLFNILRLS